MMERKSKRYRNAKIQNLFMCKKQIENLRSKILGLIEQPCQNFNWTKRQYFNIKNQSKQPKIPLSKSKQTSINLKKKEICSCKSFWSQQQQNKIKFQSTSKKIPINKRKSNIEIQKNKKVKSNSIENLNKSIQKKSIKHKITPKSIEQKQITLKPHSNFQKSIQIQIPKTHKKISNKYRSQNTQSTIDHTQRKKCESPSSILLFSRTQRVKFQNNDEELSQSFLLSQKSNKLSLERGNFENNQTKKNINLKGSQIRVSQNQQKNFKNFQIQHQDSLGISSYQSTFLKGSSRKIGKSFEPQQQQKFSKVFLLGSQKQNSKHLINKFQKQQNSQKGDLTTSWTLGSPLESSSYKRPLNLDLIKKICKRTEKFMNSEIYPFRQVLCEEETILNDHNAMGNFKSFINSKQKQQRDFQQDIQNQRKLSKLWIYDQ